MSEQQGRYTAGELASRLGGRLEGCGEVIVSGVNALEEATAEQITFIANARHARRWGSSGAGSAVVSEGLEPAGHDPERRALIYVADAELASAELLGMFAEPEVVPEEGVHAMAWVDETAVLGRGVRIGPHVSVDREAVVGAGVVLHAGVRLYARVEVGSGSVLHANCVVRQGCRLGRDVILHQNVSIGADGFGYRPGPGGRGLVKMPHIGTVVIEDGVEIGANSCVDRAKFGATVIGAGTKVDNLVQIAHNCRVGRETVIAGQTGLAGSVELGDGVRLGGDVAVAEHVRVGDGASVGGKSGLAKDVPAGESWLGYPGLRGMETLRIWAALRKLPGMVKRGSEDRSGKGG